MLGGSKNTNFPLISVSGGVCALLGWLCQDLGVTMPLRMGSGVAQPPGLLTLR